MNLVGVGKGGVLQSIMTTAFLERIPESCETELSVSIFAMIVCTFEWSEVGEFSESRQPWHYRGGGGVW